MVGSRYPGLLMEDQIAEYRRLQRERFLSSKPTRTKRPHQEATHSDARDVPMANEEKDDDIELPPRPKLPRIVERRLSPSISLIRP